MKEEKNLTIKELSEYLALGKNQTYALIQHEDFPKILDGKHILVPESALEQWLHDALNKSYSI